MTNHSLVNNTTNTECIVLCPDIETLKQTQPSQSLTLVKLLEYAQGYGCGGGTFTWLNDSIREDDGGIFFRVNALGGWLRETQGFINSDWFGYNSNDEKFNVAPVWLAVLSYAKKYGGEVTVPSRNYVYSGTIGMEVDLGIFGFVSKGCKVDASSFSGTLIRVFSSKGYPEGAYLNTIFSLSGFAFVGNRESENIGLLTGHDNYKYNGQCLIQHCSFDRFGTNIKFGNSTWRYKFNHVNSRQAKDYVLHVPVGLIDSGESIFFDHCQLFDGGGSTITISCNSFTINMISCSILNTKIIIDAAASAKLLMFGGNIENPGSSAGNKFAEVVGGHTCMLVLNGTTLTSNNPSSFRQSLFTVSKNNTLVFESIKFGSGFDNIENNESMRMYVSPGGGTVMCNNCILELNSGGNKIPVHDSFNSLYNGGFESGNNSGWLLDNQENPDQTAIVSANAAKTGSFGVRLTSYQDKGIVSLTQKIAAIPGKYILASCWRRVIKESTGSAYSGAMMVHFYNSADVNISSIGQNIASTISDWSIGGAFVCAIIPPGTAYALVSLSSQYGAIVDFDDIIINIL